MLAFYDIKLPHETRQSLISLLFWRKLLVWKNFCSVFHTNEDILKKETMPDKSHYHSHIFFVQISGIVIKH